MDEAQQANAARLLENAANRVVIDFLDGKEGDVVVTGVSDENSLCVGVFGTDITAWEALLAVRRGGGDSGIVNLGFSGEAGTPETGDDDAE